jgi:dipeptidyl aminopeptidase/acylaminoacyl peptidase
MQAFSAPALAGLFVVISTAAAAAAPGFTVEQVLSAPFASDLVVAPDGAAFAWVSNVAGRRNVWLAAAPRGKTEFSSHPVTHYTADDGLDLADVAFVPRREQLLYARGGDPEFPDKPAPNPAELTAGVEQEVFLVGFHGGAPLRLGAGHAPLASPGGDRIVYLHHGDVFTVEPRKGAKARQLFKTRGTADSLRFSPDGRKLAFVSTRADHSFVGVYTFADKSLEWLDASLSFDVEPRWSPDGKRIAFLRIPSTHDEVGLIPHRTGSPWSIRVADLAAASVTEVYRAPKGAGSVFQALTTRNWCFPTRSMDFCGTPAF